MFLMFFLQDLKERLRPTITIVEKKITVPSKKRRYTRNKGFMKIPNFANDRKKTKLKNIIKK
jgi:hypothetical protein